MRIRRVAGDVANDAKICMIGVHSKFSEEKRMVCKGNFGLGCLSKTYYGVDSQGSSHL